MPDSPAIFISYRPSDAAGHARGLHEYLSRRFGGERIFFDRGTIESGDVFPETLRQGVEECAALLALIGPQWLDASDAEGRKRLDDSGDFVRTEIALGLEHGKTVLPVLFDDTPVPPDSRLPEPLKPLASRDALTLRGKTYEYNTQRRELVRLLAKVPGIPEPYPDPGEEKPEPEGARLSELVALGTRPLEQFTEAQRETIEALKGQLGANANQLQAFFQIIGEAKVPVEQQWSRLNEIAAQYRELKVQVATEPGDAPEIARLKEKVSVALDAGQLEQVDGLFSEVEAAQDTLLERQQREMDQQRLDRAATTAGRGGVALTRLRYREAAIHFAAAAERVPPQHEEQALDYLRQEAEALYRQGDEFGDNVALADAISRIKALLDTTIRERVPLDWAMTQTNLGNALLRLGEREGGTARLEDAVAAYGAALEERTRECVPLEWAMTQTNLGTALSTLGEREIGTAHLEEAVAAYGEALSVFEAAGATHYASVARNNLKRIRALLTERCNS